MTNKENNEMKPKVYKEPTGAMVTFTINNWQLCPIGHRIDRGLGLVSLRLNAKNEMKLIKSKRTIYFFNKTARPETKLDY